MKLLENLDYKNFIGIGLVATITVASMPNIDIVINKYYQDEYKTYDYIAFSKENNFEVELNKLLSLIEMEFKYKITNYWIPAKDMLDKVCLFISFENQEELEELYDDLEIVLYENLKDFLNKSENFEMVALL